MGRGRSIVGTLARALPLALALVVGAPPGPHPILTRVALAADLAADAGHALVVHAPSSLDPRYARMRMEFAAIEMVWRDAGVTFVGLFPGLDPELMGAMPDGLSAGALRRTAPSGGAFGVRLVRADGRLVHASDGEVHRAVLLGLAMREEPIGPTAPSPPRVARVTTSAADDRPVVPDGPPVSSPVSSPVASSVPVPVMRPREVAPAIAATVAAAPSIMADASGPVPAMAPVETYPLPVIPAGPTMLDWGTPGGPSVAPADAPLATPLVVAAPTLVPADLVSPRPEPPVTAPAAPLPDLASPSAALATVETTPDVPASVPDPWSLWSGAARPTAPSADAPARATGPRPHAPGGTRRVRVVGASIPTPDRPRSPARIVPTRAPVTLADPLDALPAALPPPTIARVREALLAERLEAAEENGFDAARMDAALPLGVQARMRFAGAASLDGPDLGLALLVTRSCGATPAPRRRSSWWGG